MSHHTARSHALPRAARAALLGAVALLAVTLSAAEAEAQGARSPFESARLASLTTRLGLTPVQRLELARLRQELRADLAGDQLRLRSLEAQMRGAYQVSDPDEVRIFAIHRQLITLRRGIEQRRSRFEADCLRVLTPAQRARLGRTLQRDGLRSLAPAPRSASPAFSGLRRLMPTDSPVNR